MEGKPRAGRRTRSGRGPMHRRRGRCPACGGTEFEEGTVALYNSISYLVFNSERNKYVTLGNSLNARVCRKCGRTDLFLPPKALARKVKIRCKSR